MNSLSYGVELELLVLPRLENEENADLFREKNWNFDKSIDRQERRKNSTILRQILAEEMMSEHVPAHLTRRAYDKWIVDRDGSIFEPRDKDGVRSFCMLKINVQIYDRIR